MKLQIQWNTVSLKVQSLWILLLLLSLFGKQNVSAQNLKELEEQILQGNAPADGSSKDLLENSSAVPSTSDPAIDVEVPQLTEEEKEVVQDSDLQAIEDAIKGPAEIPHSHIMVVQRRYIRKEGRHEVIPAIVGIQPADSFRKQLEFGFGYVYHLSESFGVELLHAHLIRNVNTGLSKSIRSSVGLETDRIEPVITLGGSLQWTPLHSKSATDTSIHYFEGFFLGGGGMTRYEDQSVAMAMWGVGFRVYLTKFAIFKAEVRDYIDFKSDGADSRFNVLIGMGVLLGSGQ